MDDHVEQPSSSTKNAVYFYCDYANPPTLQPVHIYRALLRQMFFNGVMTDAIVNSVVETLRVNTNGLGEQKLINFISNAVQSYPGLYVIVDGLDECERDVQHAVTNTLGRWLAFGYPLIKVLFTCREEGHLLTRLSDFGRLQISYHASAADIKSYIAHAVASSLSSGDLTLHNPSLKEEIISTLVTKAHGMYVYFSGTVYLGLMY